MIAAVSAVISPAAIVPGQEQKRRLAARTLSSLNVF
jgi:hypothetical protein